MAMSLPEGGGEDMAEMKTEEKSIVTACASGETTHTVGDNVTDIVKLKDILSLSDMKINVSSTVAISVDATIDEKETEDEDWGGLISKDRRYVKKSSIGVDEDDLHEYKSHRVVSIEEVGWDGISQEDNKILRSLQPLSKTICAFLNSAKGGIIYIGVIDDGTIKGIILTPSQSDHVIMSVVDVLERFSPPVPPSAVTLEFVPVVSSDTEWKDSYLDEYLKPNKRRSETNHVIRTNDYCFCERDALALCTHGLIPMSFVIEVRVSAWDGARDPTSRLDIPLSPIYQNEEGLVYYRGLAANIQVDLNELVMLKEAEVKEHLDREKEGLKARVVQAVEALQEKATPTPRPHQPPATAD